MATTFQTVPTFAERVKHELSRARSKHTPINSAHEGYAVILEELDEFKKEVWKKRKERDPKQMLDELVQVGAMAQRVAEDLNLAEDGCPARRIGFLPQTQETEAFFDDN